jgi:ABC-2 type transport system ATP-binding protein
MGSNPKDAKDIAVRVDGISKTFKLPHERTSSLKSALINFRRRPGKTFEKQKALQDISFTIAKGDFFAIVGRNGSGKSTLLKMLAGIYTPDAGHIQVEGKLIPFIELGVGFNPELTGRENVFLNGALLGFNHREMEVMYDDIVEFAELERFMDQKLKNYSSGMQVRLAFSIAIRAQGDILLLDEVLAVGDSAFQQKCYNYFEDLKQQGKTVVFVSHDMSAVRRFCTKAIYIKNGEFILGGTPFEVAEQYEIDNVASPKKQTGGKDDDRRSTTHSVSTEVIDYKDNTLLLGVSYESKDEDEIYVGISVIRDGISIAEINTVNQLKLVGNGKATYTLDTSIFNAGIYYITVALFRRKNREILCLGSNKSKFIVKGNDDTKGAALKLASTWKAGV